MQVFLQSGRSPTLLQLLCNLPFEYFSNYQYVMYTTYTAYCGHTLAAMHTVCYWQWENLMHVSYPLCSLSSLLFPTLLSACYLSHENTAILRQEISCQLLVTFLTSHISHGSTPTTGIL